MLSKIFLALLAICTVLTAFFSWYALSWLQSIGRPSAAAEGYAYHDGLAWTTLIASGVILLVVGNVVLWTTRRAWALWSAFLYFAVFAAVRYFWMGPQFLHFKADSGMSETAYSAAPLVGAILIIVAGIFTFCDHFAVLQLHRKMYPQTPVLDNGQFDTLEDPKLEE